MSDEITSDSFSFVDEVPEKGNPVSSAEYTCDVCGTDLIYSGRGRKPKYCADHKPGRKSTGGSVRVAKGGVVERAVTELTALYGMAGQSLKFVNKPAGEIVYQSRAELAESYRMLLETNARFRKLFADLESKAAWLPIIMVHGELIANIWVAIGVARMNDQVEEYVNHTADDVQ